MKPSNKLSNLLLSLAFGLNLGYLGTAALNAGANTGDVVSAMVLLLAVYLVRIAKWDKKGGDAPYESHRDRYR